MLSDRHYMREDYGRPFPSVLIWLIGVNIAVFLLQMTLQVWVSARAGATFNYYLGLSRTGLADGQFWTLLSYGLLSAGVLQLLVNALAIFFLGRELQTVMSARRILALYIGAILAGGLLWTAAHWHLEGSMMGATAGVMGLLMAFACFFPDREITFLLFLIVPVTVRPKWLVLFFGALDLFGLLFFELVHGAGLFGAAHSAHLGGLAAGWVYCRYLHDLEIPTPARRRDIELPRWLRKTGKAVNRPVYHVNLGNREDLRAEVDRILDKINSKGFGALSVEEKRVLDEAKDLTSRH
ncbi:MAG: rhomboid family intramembrane serine protease [Verrucomicrobiota bacterium]|nr:rhomboid family intramembrane serine protease [Verrucomicrobiota bacterium]